MCHFTANDPKECGLFGEEKFGKEEYFDDEIDGADIHPVSDEDLFSKIITITIGEKAKKKLNEIHELFLDLQFLMKLSASAVTETHLRNAFRELLYLVGSRNDPCFVADFPDDHECTYYKKRVESEVIGLIHSPLSHVIPPLTTWHSLLLETSPLPSENLDSILILLSQSREMLEASLEALQRS